MTKVKIITDSNSGIHQNDCGDIFVIPMPFTINGDEYLEEVSISNEQFYNFLENNADVTTSQPSRFYLQELFDDMLKEHDQIVYIPMSSGLSGTCANALSLAGEYDGKVEVVDNLGISVTQKCSVYEALALSKQGKNAQEIKQHLENQKGLTSIYIVPTTLKYLKKGGRITPAAAALASLLKIKPILSSSGKSFEKSAICLNLAQAKKKMIGLIKQDLAVKFKQIYDNGNVVLSVAHTNNENEALRFKEEIMREIPNVEVRYVDQLSLSVSCHIGPGAIAIALFTNEIKY